MQKCLAEEQKKTHRANCADEKQLFTKPQNENDKKKSYY